MLVFLQWVACSTSEPDVAVAPKSGRHAPPPSAHAVAVEQATNSENNDRTANNRPPIVRTITMTPGLPTRLETLVATVDALDPDGDSVNLEYDWLVNGKAVPRARKPQLALGDFARGDILVLRVSATDYVGTTVVDSDEIIIANAAPVIQTNPVRIKVIDGFAVSAVDPDDDPLSWTVEGGPPSMTVDAEGVLHWQGTETDPGGQFTAKILVADAFGGRATLELPLDIAAGKVGKAPAGEAVKGVDAAASER